MAYRSYRDDLHTDALPDYLADATDPSKGPRPMAAPTKPSPATIDYTYPGTAPTEATPGTATPGTVTPTYTYPGDPALGRGAVPSPPGVPPTAPPGLGQRTYPQRWMQTPPGQTLIRDLVGEFGMSDAEAAQYLNYPQMPDARFIEAIRANLRPARLSPPLTTTAPVAPSPPGTLAALLTAGAVPTRRTY